MLIDVGRDACGHGQDTCGCGRGRDANGCGQDVGRHGQNVSGRDALGHDTPRRANPMGAHAGKPLGSQTT